MARSVFLLLSICIICLFSLLIASAYENKGLVEKIERNSIIIDSLNDECTIKDLSLDKYEFIIEDLKSKHPKKVNKIYNEAE